MQNKKIRDQVKTIMDYALALNRKLDGTVHSLAYHGETLAAIVDILGEEVLTAKIKELRLKRKEKSEQQLKEGVAFLLDNKLADRLKDEDPITIDCFVVGEEIGADGSSRIQHEVRRLDQEGQARYLGKKVGDDVTVPGAKTKVVIKEVYLLNSQAIKEYIQKNDTSQDGKNAVSDPAPAPVPAVPAA